MCLECLKKAASSYDRLPLTPHEPPAAPTGIPAIQALSVPERRGIVAQVRRLIWKSFAKRPGARGLPRAGAPSRVRSRPSRVQGTSMPLPEPPRAQTFFGFFLRAGPIQPLGASLTHWNRQCFRNNPPCDDFLTIGVDNPDGWGL
jgi:hypothetical protein